MRKSLMFLIVILLLVVTVPSPTVSAKSDGDFVYTVSGNEATITSFGREPESHIIIPETLNGGKYKVTKIGPFAFYGKEALEKVTLPDSLTVIETKAFAECENLDEITGGANLELVEPDAFNNTAYYNNKSNYIDGILYFGNFILFVDSEAELHVKIKDGVKYIPRSAFSNHKYLLSVTLPDSVTRIEAHAFTQCKYLKEIHGGKKVSFVANYAFPSTTPVLNIINGYLTSVTTTDAEIVLPEGVRVISERAFNYQGDLVTIKLPDGLEYINDRAFFGCERLGEITLPATVKQIGDFAFEKCESLKSLTVLGMDTEIAKTAFFDSSNFNLYYPDKIYCQQGSKAESFAKKHKIPFEYISPAPQSEANPTAPPLDLPILEIAVVLLGVLALVEGVLLIILKRKLR